MVREVIGQVRGRMSEEEYRADEGVNKTTLWELRRSPQHYRYLLLHPAEDTPTLRFGRAVHAAILTPAAYKRDFARAPALNLRTKAGKEEYEAWAAGLPLGSTILTAEEAETVSAMRDAFRANKEAKALLRYSRREVPFFWTDKETGQRCKCRADAISPTMVMDLKTTQDAGTKAFQRDAIKYGYHIQAAHYLAGIEAVTGQKRDWYFVALEKKQPFGVHVFKADDEFLEFGAFERAELLAVLKRCRDEGRWPGYQSNILTAPYWAIKEAIDGDSLEKADES